MMTMTRPDVCETKNSKTYLIKEDGDAYAVYTDRDGWTEARMYHVDESGSIIKDYYGDDDYTIPAAGASGEGTNYLASILLYAHENGKSISVIE